MVCNGEGVRVKGDDGIDDGVKGLDAGEKGGDDAAASCLVGEEGVVDVFGGCCSWVEGIIVEGVGCCAERQEDSQRLDEYPWQHYEKFDDNRSFCFE